MKYDIEKYSYYALIGAAFFTPFSLPLGRLSVAVALILLVITNVKKGKLLRFPMVAWFALAWILLACVVTINGVNPERGVPRLEKLLWFIAIPITTSLIYNIKRLQAVMYAFVAGGVVLSLDVLIMNTVHALKAYHAGNFSSITAAIVNEGSMTDGQILACTILATLAAVFVNKMRQRKLLWLVFALALQIFAIIINFKRGSWISLLAMVILFIAVKINWKSLFILLAVVLLTLMLPPVQGRLASLKSEFNPDAGGRATMWVVIAPALIKEYPWGIGYKSLTNEMMHNIFWRVEKDRDHLHSNIVQLLVATGWAGLVLYLLWMAVALKDGLRFIYLSKGSPAEEGTYALGLCLMLVALYVNGLVEYNFGDAEIVLVYSIIMGAMAAGVRRVERLRLSMFFVTELFCDPAFVLR